MKTIRKRLSLNPIVRMKYRINHYLKALDKCPPQVRREIHGHRREFERLYRKVTTLRIIRNVCFILLYVSLVSTVIGNFMFLKEILEVITLISGIIGSTVLIVIIYLLTKIIEAYVSEAYLEASFIIAIIVKYRELKR